MCCMQVPDPDQEAAMQMNASESSSLLPASAAAAGAGAAAGAAAAGASSQQPSKRQRLYQAPEVRRPFSVHSLMCGNSASLQMQCLCVHTNEAFLCIPSLGTQQLPVSGESSVYSRVVRGKCRSCSKAMRLQKIAQIRGTAAA